MVPLSMGDQGPEGSGLLALSPEVKTWSVDAQEGRVVNPGSNRQRPKILQSFCIVCLPLAERMARAYIEGRAAVPVLSQ